MTKMTMMMMMMIINDAKIITITKIRTIITMRMFSDKIALVGYIARVIPYNRDIKENVKN